MEFETNSNSSSSNSAESSSLLDYVKDQPPEDFKNLKNSEEVDSGEKETNEFYCHSNGLVHEQSSTNENQNKINSSLNDDLTSPSIMEPKVQIFEGSQCIKTEAFDEHNLPVHMLDSDAHNNVPSTTQSNVSFKCNQCLYEYATLKEAEACSENTHKQCAKCGHIFNRFDGTAKCQCASGDLTLASFQENCDTGGLTNNIWSDEATDFLVNEMKIYYSDYIGRSKQKLYFMRKIAEHLKPMKIVTPIQVKNKWNNLFSKYKFYRDNLNIIGPKKLRAPRFHDKIHAFINYKPNINPIQNESNNSMLSSTQITPKKYPAAVVTSNPTFNTTPSTKPAFSIKSPFTINPISSSEKYSGKKRLRDSFYESDDDDFMSPSQVNRGSPPLKTIKNSVPNNMYKDLETSINNLNKTLQINNNKKRTIISEDQHQDLIEAINDMNNTIKNSHSLMHKELATTNSLLREFVDLEKKRLALMKNN